MRSDKGDDAEEVEEDDEEEAPPVAEKREEDIPVVKKPSISESPSKAGTPAESKDKSKVIGPAKPEFLSPTEKEEPAEEDEEEEDAPKEAKKRRRNRVRPHKKDKVPEFCYSGVHRSTIFHLNLTFR